MDFDIYCDESRGDLFSSKNRNGQYLVIGAIWLESTARAELKKEIHSLRDKHKVGPEFKWHSVSQRDFQFYCEIIDLFMTHKSALRFRCIAVDPSKCDFAKYHNNNPELGFYKFYYLMLDKWLTANNSYKIFCDYKIDSTSYLQKMKEILNRANLLVDVELVQAVHSHESVLIQFADLLTGIASAKLNNNLVKGSTKARLLEYLESKMERPIEATYASETKFNVFVINPGGGW